MTGDKGKMIPAVLFAVYAVASVVIPYFDSGNPITSMDVIVIVSAVLTAVGTYITPLIPQAGWTKSAIGAALVGLTALGIVLPGGLTGGDVLDIAVAVLAALGIQVGAATSDNGVRVNLGSDAPTVRP